MNKQKEKENKLMRAHAKRNSKEFSVREEKHSRYVVEYIHARGATILCRDSTVTSSYPEVP